MALSKPRDEAGEVKVLRKVKNRKDKELMAIYKEWKAPHDPGLIPQIGFLIWQINRIANLYADYNNGKGIWKRLEPSDYPGIPESYFNPPPKGRSMRSGGSVSPLTCQGNCYQNYLKCLQLGYSPTTCENYYYNCVAGC